MNLIELIDWDKFTNKKENEMSRLFHGRGFKYVEYSHLNIEWLDPVVLIILYKEVKQDWLETLSKQLNQRITSLGFIVKSIQVQYRCRDFAPSEILFGEPITDLVAEENSLKYNINLGSKQNYGIFLDMKNGRNWLQNNSQDKKILNLFSYTCAFSVAAIEGGATEVINLDMSKAALCVGRENHRLNKHDLNKVKYLGHDLFKSWGKLKRSGPFDIVIADPPSLQKGSVNIKRDYPKIIRKLPSLLNDGGYALLCLNSPDLDFKFLEETISIECPDAIIIKKIMPEPMFINIEPDRGLKSLLVQVFTK